MISCPSCAKINRPNSRFCNVCGWRLDFVIRCSACGSTNVGDAVFCNECGLSFGSQPPPNFAAGAASAPPVAPTGITVSDVVAATVTPDVAAEVAEPSPDLQRASASESTVPESVDNPVDVPIVSVAEPAGSEPGIVQPDSSWDALLPRLDETADPAQSFEPIAMPEEVESVGTVGQIEPTEAVDQIAPVDAAEMVEPSQQIDPVVDDADAEYAEHAETEDIAEATVVGPSSSEPKWPTFDPAPPVKSSPPPAEPTRADFDSTPPAGASQPQNGFDWSAIADLEAITPPQATPPAEPAGRPTEEERIGPVSAIPTIAAPANGAATLTPATVGEPAKSWLDSAEEDRPAAVVAPVDSVDDEAADSLESGIVLARSFAAGRPTISATAIPSPLDAEASAIAAIAGATQRPAARTRRRFRLPEWIVVVILIIIIAIAFSLSLRAGVLNLASALPTGVGGIVAAGAITTIRTPVC